MYHPSPFSWSPTGGRHGIKRKNIVTPDTILPPPPEKHFVTEEEMTEELRRLQIMEAMPGPSMLAPPFTANLPVVAPPFTANVPVAPPLTANLPVVAPPSTAINPSWSPATLQNEINNHPSTSWAPPVIPDHKVYSQFQESTANACNQPFLFNSQGQFSGFGSNNNAEADKDMDDDGSGTNLPRLTISDEVYKIEPEPILPTSLMNTLPNRQMALIPWVPPILPLHVETEKKKNEDDMDF